MIAIEIPPNPNCPEVDLRVFNDLAPARAVSRVRLARDGGPLQWYDIVSWTLSGTPQGPALAQKVDDSGEGVAILIYGGEAGLRLKPAGSTAPWGLQQPEQWGEAFLITTDTDDVQWASDAKES